MAAPTSAAESSTTPLPTESRPHRVEMRLWLAAGTRAFRLPSRPALNSSQDHPRRRARNSEILNLTWGEVDLERGQILLPWHRSKTGEKMIPLNSAAVAEIMRRSRAGPYVFPAARGDGPTFGLYKTWDRVREVAKLDGVRLHDLRHSFASFAAADGASLYLIGKALGHRQTSTTERYAHLTDDPIRAVAEQVGLRFIKSASE